MIQYITIFIFITAFIIQSVAVFLIFLKVYEIDENYKYSKKEIKRIKKLLSKKNNYICYS